MVPSSTSRRTIKSFWRWFQYESKRLASLYDKGQLELLSAEINSQLDLVSNKLAWEIGSGSKADHSLTISAEGNPSLRELANSVIRVAPRIQGWEFYSSKQARGVQSVIRLPNRRTVISTRHWRFVPQEDSELGRIHLTIVDSRLPALDRQTALSAVSIFLDALLGEDEVEEWIGRLNVKNPDRVSVRSFPILDLPDYVTWATQRPEKPLTKVSE